MLHTETSFKSPLSFRNFDLKVDPRFLFRKEFQNDLVWFQTRFYYITKDGYKTIAQKEIHAWDIKFLKTMSVIKYDDN